MADNNATGSVIARCLAVASRCVAHRNSLFANQFMKAQFREIAEEIAVWGLSAQDKAELILGPTRTGLIEQHGLEAGWMLYLDFVDSFWTGSWGDVALVDADSDRFATLSAF